jgi:hypothetical protein
MLNKFKNTQAYIHNYSEHLVKLLKIEIGRNRTRKYSSGTYNSPIDTTGKLRESIEAIQKMQKDSFSSQIMMNDYGVVVDQGRAIGAEPPYQDIVDWVKRKRIRIRDTKGRFVTADEYRLAKLTNNIRRKIGREGTQPTGFIQDAIDQSIEKLNKLGAAVGEDVMLNLNDILVKAGYIKKGEEYTIQSNK